MNPTKNKQVPGANLKKVSISRIKQEMGDVSYLSDDLVITSLDARHNTTAEYPVAIDGFSVIIMIAGEAVVSIDMKEHQCAPTTSSSSTRAASSARSEARTTPRRSC